MTRALKLAITLGAAPLLIGTLIYTAWRFKRVEWAGVLIVAGMCTIVIGLVAFTVGMIALTRHLDHASRVRGANSRTLRLQRVLVGGLLLANFPVAAFFAYSANDLLIRHTVRVYNDSERPIESFVVTGPGVRVELGPLAPGERNRRHLYFQGEGSLEFSAKQQELQFAGVVEEYVRMPMGGDSTIGVGQRGAFKVHDNLR